MTRYDDWDLTNERILVADDNPNNLRVMESILREFGCAVRVVLDGEAAVKSAHAELPGLIILDIHMPKLDGFDACARLKESEKTRDIPIIFASSLNEEFHKVKGFELGAVDYVTKPLQMEELRARIGVHLACARQRKRLVEQADDLRTFNESMLDREMRVIELKKEVNQFAHELGRDAPYPETEE